MQKKGFFIGFYLDIWGWFILALGLTAWFLLSVFSSPDETGMVTGQITSQVNSDDELRLYLMTPLDGSVNGKTVLDHIVDKYQVLGYDDAELVEFLTRIFKHRYGKGRDVCWKISNVVDTGVEVLTHSRCGDNIEQAF